MRFPRHARLLAFLAWASACGSAFADMASGIAAYSRGDFASALDEFRVAGKQDNPQALNLIGIMHAEGQGVERDYKKAADWFFKAQALGSLEAMANLGRMYGLGLGVPKSEATALKLLRDAALGGYRPAMLRLADIYEKAELGLTPDPGEAKAWRARAGGPGSEYFDLRKLPPPGKPEPGANSTNRPHVAAVPVHKPVARQITPVQPNPSDLLEKQLFERLEKYGKRERKLSVPSTDKTPALAAYLEGLRLKCKQLLAGEFSEHKAGMTVTLLVMPDGVIRSVELDKSSGDADLDRKILSRIRKSGRQSSFTAAMRELADVLEVTVTLPIH